MKQLGCKTKSITKSKSFVEQESDFVQEERGHWTVYYTSPQSLIITISYPLALQPWTLGFLIVWLIYLSVETTQSLIASTEGVIMCIITGDVHQFIGHCFIPLDP